MLQIDIAEGGSAHSTNWRMKTYNWVDFAAKLAVTTRTKEKLADYMKMSSVEQDNIKDVGGFVGGQLSGGKRGMKNVVNRCLVTLDFDHVPAGVDLWGMFTNIYDVAACIYSTHKHKPTAPRLRLIIPLSEAVNREEYEAISRKIADNLNIEYSDPTTFQANRLMFWPSTAVDGEYYYQVQEGEALNPSSVLKQYRDWRDIAEWPYHDGRYKRDMKAIKDAGDPLEKPGIIGAFCREFSIAEAIQEFLSDVYKRSDKNDRYTFIEGSTSGGLIVYDDKFAYSHHATDPAGQKLCNAFDLVRLHKFGSKDEKAAEATPVNKLPSFLAMQEFAAQHPNVKKRLIEEKIESAKAAFEGLLGKDEDTSLAVDGEGELVSQSDEWLKQLDTNKKGVVENTLSNLTIILENDPRIKGRFGIDMLASREAVIKKPHWRTKDQKEEYFTNTDKSNLTLYIEQVYQVEPSDRKLENAMRIVFNKNRFHPIKQYFSNLAEWDGVERIKDLLSDFLGVQASKYTALIMRKWMVAAVRRILQPGVKFDHCLILVGAQGLQKSMFFDKLALSKWFSDSLSSLESTKENFEQLSGSWIFELAELSALSKAAVEQVKHFISKREDVYRIPFEKRVDKFPRQIVFAATTNTFQFLIDDENRRWWPAICHVNKPTKSIAEDLTPEYAGLLWAEALHLERTGYKIYVDTPEFKEEAEKMQKAHTRVDDREGLIANYLSVKRPEGWDKMDRYERASYLNSEHEEGIYLPERACALEIYEVVLGGSRSNMQKNSLQGIHDILKRLEGWKDVGQKRYGAYGPQKVYENEANILHNKNTLQKV